MLSSRVIKKLENLKFEKLSITKKLEGIKTELKEPEIKIIRKRFMKELKTEKIMEKKTKTDKK